MASSYLVWQQREGHILDNTGLFGFFGLDRIIYHNQTIYVPSTPEFFGYLTEFLESPERSGTHIFDQKQYATAAKECLQLYLCNHYNFSKGATDFAYHDNKMRRSKPWEWIVRLGVHSRIRKGRHHFKFLQCQSIGALGSIYQEHLFPKNAPEHQYYQSLSYQWALDLLPFLLEKSVVSLQLADLLHGCTFAWMAWEFPQQMQLVKKAITRYLSWVESAAGAA